MPVEKAAIAATSANAINGDSSSARPLRWTVDEFHRMGDMGWFEGRRVELIEGEIIEMSPMGSHHVTSVHKAARALERAFGAGFYTRVQSPLIVHSRTDPEPDIAVVRGDIEDYAESHPTPAETVLVVEISDTTLERDRNYKASLYASAGIAEYWIVDVAARRLEVRRQPIAAADQPFLASYSQTQTFTVAQEVSPLAAPHATIRAADLLP